MRLIDENMRKKQAQPEVELAPGSRRTTGMRRGSGSGAGWLGAWVVVLVCGLVLVHPAYAQEIQPVNDMADFIVGVLTGRLATALARIAVAGGGALALSTDFPRD